MLISTPCGSSVETPHCSWVWHFYTPRFKTAPHTKGHGSVEDPARHGPCVWEEMREALPAAEGRQGSQHKPSPVAAFSKRSGKCTVTHWGWNYKTGWEKWKILDFRPIMADSTATHLRYNWGKNWLLSIRTPQPPCRKRLSLKNTL